MANQSTLQFHGISDLAALEDAEEVNAAPAPPPDAPVLTRTVMLTFEMHYHPYVRELIQRLIERSVRGLQGADTDNPPLDTAFFAKDYEPNDAAVDKSSHPIRNLDFRPEGAYSVYNWELFFHIPLTVALHLSKNQRFEEAQRWLHYIFDPTTSSAEAAPKRFWNVAPFKTTTVKSIERLLLDLAEKKGDASLIESIEQWKKNPFRPHLIARYRQSAYMWKAVMTYLDNLIAWGDSLFAQDTGESINEATQLYILAANLLGPRPQPVPRGGGVRPKTYNDLRSDLDSFSNALVALETDIPFDAAPLPDDGSDPAPMATLESLGKTLYFCVPRNDKLLGYWDTVADRLFKIRNSLNLQGIFRQLPLFEPPIDPAVLARAVAAGVDVAAAVSGVRQPLPLVRFQLLLQKALEICGEVKSLGQNLLSTIEKQDGEALAILRARQESVILKLGEAVRYGQWQEAIKAREGLERSLTTAAQRFTYYERQLGKQESDIQIPELAPLDTDGLLRTRLRTGEPQIAPRSIQIQLGSSFRDGGHKLNPAEANELDLMEGAQIAQDVASGLDATGAFLSLIPDFSGHVSPIGVGAAIRFGGTNLGHLFRGLATVARGVADRVSHEAQISGKLAGYDRREQEWALQSNLAAGEITAIYKQIRAAQIREAVAKREWENHQQQIKNAEEMERFLTDEKKGKVTNQAFYALLRREVKGLYGQAFQLAFEIARKAERALGHELGDASRTYLQAGYLAGKEGLLAGEKLYLDLKRMENAYLDQNRRDYELTKHVSLLELAPLAVMQLRATGRCTVKLPEELFDLDGPGHYFRRIKSVAVSLPCVAGPYTSVNVTLSLLKSTIRTSALLTDGKYAPIGGEDLRFDSHFGSSETIVTSSAQNDAGLFEPNLKDERYLPFEYAGAISEWQIQLPSAVRQFDFATITDVILHVRYTAREGGELLRRGAVENLKARIEGAATAGSVRLLSARHEFPAEWAKLKSSSAGKPIEWTVELRDEHYPLWSKDQSGGKKRTVKRVGLFAEAPAAFKVFEDKTGGGDPSVTLGKDSATGLFVGVLPDKQRPASPTGKYTLFFEDKAAAATDIWFALTWGQE
jgi:Tc toxin complex TcA C-terminal TcB-binding domain